MSILRLRLDRQALWSALRGICIPTFLLDLIKDLHLGTTAKVRVNVTLSKMITTMSGIRQGCILAFLQSHGLVTSLSGVSRWKMSQFTHSIWIAYKTQMEGAGLVSYAESVWLLQQ